MPSRSLPGRQRFSPQLTLGALLLLVVVIAMGLASRLLLSSYRQVEDATVRQRVEQVQRALDTDLRQLALSNRDYAEWDDAEEFARTGDPAFIAGNFSRESLDGMHVDLVLITLATGELQYSAYLPRGGTALASPAPRELVSALAPYGRVTDAIRASEPIDRIVVTAQGPIGFAVRQITRSNLTQPAGKYLLFARFLAAAELGRVRQTSHLPADLYTLGQERRADSGLPADIAAWAAAASAGEASRARVAGTGRIEGYFLLRDFSGQPVAVLGTSAPRTIYALGYRTTWMLLATIAALLLATGTIVMYVLWRLQRSHAARRAADARYRNITSQLTEVIVIADESQGRIVDANQAALKALDCSLDEARTLTISSVFPDLDLARLLSESGQRRERLIRNSRLAGDGTGSRPMEVSVTSLGSADGRMLCLVGHDISHRLRAEEQQRANQRRLVHMAQHDSLTGLPNRLYLRARLPRALRLSAATGKSLALIYLDVDHFKSINDSRGHGFGDQLLQIVAGRLRNAVAAEDVVVRMGGDEFVIVVTLAGSQEQVEAVVRRLHTTIGAPLSVGDAQVSISSSMGVAMHPDDALDTEGLLRHADIALYQAKEAGRNTHRFFVADMDLRVSEDVALEQALRHAVGTDQFYMEYQPVVEISTSRVSSVEALIRWRHPELGTVPPSRFIAAAEKVGVITELGEQALTMVLQQLREWLTTGVHCVPVAVNVSPKQLTSADFAAQLRKLAAHFGVEPRWLRCEITESVLLHGTDRIIATLRDLRAMGTQVLIDDFGTGYSSLGYLERMPFDTLKIDRSFVAPLGTEQRESTVVRAIIDLARKLNLGTVAEGVETMEQLVVLRELGCTHVQGYFFSRPLSARRCRHLLECATPGRNTDDTVLHRIAAAG